MTFKNWIFSEYNELGISNNLNGAWKLPHIIVLLLTIGISVAIALLLRKKSERTRYTTVFTISLLILFFEIARRLINFIKCGDGQMSPNDFFFIVLPRPWCAISCWLLIASPFVNKKWFYNFTAMNALLCGIIFFSYPTAAGFNSDVWLFENYYSIFTHMLLLIGSISLMTLKMTDFKYVEEGGGWKKSAIRELIALVCVFLYATVLVVFNIEKNPLYFMPTGDYVLAGSKVHIANDVMDIVGVPSGLFLVLYVIFLVFYFNLYYLIQNRVQVGEFFKACFAKVKGWFAKKAVAEQATEAAQTAETQDEQTESE